MGRVTVHTHGVPKDKAMGQLIGRYGARIKSRGVSLEHHPSNCLLYTSDAADEV